MSAILSAYAQDIEFTVHPEHCRIEGVVFMVNHDAVFFIVSVFEEKGPRPRSKIEFLRSSGSALSFSRFWGDLKALYLGEDPIESAPYSEPLGVPNGRSGPDAVSGQSARRALGELSASLSADDEFAADFLRIFSASKLGRTVRANEVLADEKTVGALIAAAMNPSDIRVARGAAAILTEAISECNEWPAMAALMERHGLKLMRSIISMLNSRRVLIQKYAVRLLSALSTFSEDIEWDDVFTAFGDGLNAKRDLLSSCRQFEAKWNAQRKERGHAVADGLGHSMFDDIQRAMFR